MKNVQLIEYPHVPGFFIKYEDGKLVSSCCDKDGNDYYLTLRDGSTPKGTGVLDLIKYTGCYHHTGQKGET